MSKTKVVKSGDNTYYNVSIAHDDTVSVNGSPTEARYFEVRSTNLFEGPPDDYTMSVVRMKIPTSLIPIQIFPNNPEPSVPGDINESLYTLTLSWNGIDKQVPLEWIPQINFPPNDNRIPPSPDVGINRKQYAVYYSLFSLQHFVDLINNAFIAAFDLIVLEGSPVTAPPFMYYDTTTKLVSLFVPDDYETVPVDIYFNNFLIDNFGLSFDVVCETFTPPPPNGKDCKFVIKAKNLNFEPIDVPSYGTSVYIKSTQEYNTLSDMTSFQSIVLASRSIPVRKEWISQQNIRVALGRPSLPANNTTQDNFINILTDYEIDIVDGFEFRNNVIYNPTAEYRRATLLGNSPIRTIDIQVFWKDNFDNLYELLIPSHDVLTIKILFEKK